MSQSPSSAAIECFIERIGLSVEADGLPRIAGRIMGFFVIHGGPVSFTELADRLQVSRGSVSTNARLLASLGIIEKISLPGDRQNYYQLSERPYVRLIEGYIKRQQDMEAVVKEVQAKMPTTMKATRTRLRELQAFYKTAAEQLQQLVVKIK
jgi:DNA-binding transcriptional regulator GbsR (MarR family)